MPILTKVETKSRSGRAIHAGIFLALIVGGVTMLYPFLLMFSGAMRSSMDAAEMDLVPDFLTDSTVLVRKFLETKYNYDPIAMNRYRQTRDYSFQDASIPARLSTQAIADFRQFADNDNLPPHWQVLGATHYYKQMESAVLAKFRRRARARYNDDLAAVGADLGTPLRSWGHLDLIMPAWENHRYTFVPNLLFEEYFQLLKERPMAERAYVNLTGSFLENILYPEYGISSVAQYNQAHVQRLASYEAFALPRTVPDAAQPKLRQEWLQFALEQCHPSFVRTDLPATHYQQYLREQYGSIAKLNAHWGDTLYEAFADIALPSELDWVPAAQALDYMEFLRQLPPERLYLVGPEFAWRDALQARYGSLAKLNARHGTDYVNWQQCRMPLAQLEAAYVYANQPALRWRYATRNFRIVSSQIFVQGRSFVNTITYVALALLFSLTIQPLAAYALSRFKPPGMWKIIFILMATMAFPPMVSTIPLFLLIKKMNLLNTFVALVLPVTINGYLIFLLKGFFDSIPEHLYEAAQIEGASEAYMFWQVTMALSKPILAVVALNTFRLAWMSFMYPLLVCPDEKMHVLAVWLHQFQQNAPGSAVFASILVASLPTLAIFMLTQKTIMQGIAVPAEK